MISGEKPKHKFPVLGPVLGVIGGSYSSVSLQVNNGLTHPSDNQLYIAMIGIRCT